MILGGTDDYERAMAEAFVFNTITNTVKEVPWGGQKLDAKANQSV